MINMTMEKPTLKTLRLLHGLTQEQAGQCIGVAGTTWQRYELGKTIPNIKTCSRIAKAFGVKLDDINFLC